jgi:hypothetical protein
MPLPRVPRTERQSFRFLGIVEPATPRSNIAYSEFELRRNVRAKWTGDLLVLSGNALLLRRLQRTLRRLSMACQVSSVVEVGEGRLPRRIA